MLDFKCTRYAVSTTQYYSAGRFFSAGIAIASAQLGTIGFTNLDETCNETRGGGSRAVWSFSENSSKFVNPIVPYSI